MMNHRRLLVLPLLLAGCNLPEGSNPDWNLTDEMMEEDRDLILLPAPDEIPYVDNRFHLFRLSTNNVVYVWYWDGYYWQELDEPVFVPEGWYIGPEICPIEVVIPTHDDLLRP